MKRTGRTSCPFYFRVSFCGQRVALYPGYGVESAADWDAKNNKVKPTNKNADFLNAQILTDMAALNKLMVTYTIDNERSAPTAPELRTAFLAAIGRPDAVEKAESKRQFLDIYDEFLKENSNDWAYHTFCGYVSLRKNLSSWKSNADFNDFDEDGLSSLLNYLYSVLNNNSVIKKVDLLRRFFKWCNKKEYTINKAVLDWRPKVKTLKGDNKEIIYLSFEELMQFLNFDFPADCKNLAACRDVFLFCSFTGLRYSDVKKLKKSDISPDLSFINVVTQKTADVLRIETNKYSRLILSRWSGENLRNDAALPVFTNTVYNKDIKLAAKMAGLNGKQRIVYFKKNKRVEEVFEKWQIITTHAARRSFVVNALRLGIPATVIMKWTGHSNYEAMKPYVKIVDELKAENMAKFDSLGDK